MPTAVGPKVYCEECEQEISLEDYLEYDGLCLACANRATIGAEDFPSMIEIDLE